MAPKCFFKLLLVGYLENLNSDRRIIEHARMRLDILYFIGYDIDEALPWHSTLSRIRQLYGEEVFVALFQKVLNLCVSKGMVGGNQAISPYKRTAENSNGYVMKTYRSSETVCKNCPLKGQCIGKSNFKKLDESIDKPLYDEMHERLKTRKAKIYKELRSSTVEPVLGILINFMGMRRI